MTNATNPTDLHRLFAEAVNAADLTALLALYEPDSLTVGLDGTRYAGEEALRENLRVVLAGIEHIDGVTRKALVHGDVALMSANFIGRATGPGGAPVTFTGTTGEVARRRPDGTWRFLIDDPLFFS